MDSSPNISAHGDKACIRCHHDLSQLPTSAHFCPRCGQNQIEIPVAAVNESYFPPPPPAPEYFHSVVVVGYARAMTQLGTRYEAGHGVARNSDEALRCYCKAARLGNSEARSRLITRGIPTEVRMADKNVRPTSPDAPSDQPSPPVATAPQTL